MKHTTKKKSFSYLLALTCLIMNAGISANSTAVQLANIDPDNGGSISTPGRYYLGWDITGDVTFAADNVILDLNGHIVKSISVADHNDVTITNGVVDGSTANGVNISNCDSVHISYISVLNAGGSGINVSGTSQNIFISDVLIDGAGAVGCNLNSTTTLNAIVSNSLVTNSGSSGISVTGSQAVFKDCSSTLNTSVGYFIGQGSTQIYFFNCYAGENTDNGFQTSASGSSYVASKCLSQENGGGGFVGGSNCPSISLIHCLARSNTDEGFFMKGDQHGFLKHCVAASNGPCGFEYDGSGTLDFPLVCFVGNFSYDHTKNYCLSGACVGGTGRPYCTVGRDADNAQYWRNIDNDPCTA